MNNKNDWIMRQLDSFAQGLGYVLSKGRSGSQSEIVFLQNQSEKLPYKDEISKLLEGNEYSKAAKRILKIQYSMPEEQFLELSKWFYPSMNIDAMKTTEYGVLNRESVVAGLKKLVEMDI